MRMSVTSEPSLTQQSSKLESTVSTEKTVAVIIPCFDSGRLGLVLRAIQSVHSQDYPHNLIIVVDYNEDLYEQVQVSVPDQVVVMRNERSKGAAGARNTAALDSKADLLAFLDDDAIAERGWLRTLVQAMDYPNTVGVGGRLIAGWQTDRPRWFPDELGWVVGTSFPEQNSEPYFVRNVWAGSMMVDSSAFQTVNGFREDLSKVGLLAQPEDTELCLRISRAFGPAGQWMMVPSALAEHYVPQHRAKLKYVITRCWSEGTGKVRMRMVTVGDNQVLRDEKAYIRSTIPRAVKTEILSSLRSRNSDGLLRAGTMMLGITTAGIAACVALLRAVNKRQPPGASS
jgi:GT2 family glycosyltransferase